jgi:signal transduction histidine kinase
MIYALRSSSSVGQEFLPSLEEFLRAYREHYGLDVQLFVDDQPFPQLPVDVRLQIIRIIQEALSNAGQHSGTTQACIRSRRDGAWLQVSVEDRGRGFDPAAGEGEDRHRFGLLTMRERAASVGGTLEIDSQPGRGTRVVLRLPLDECDGDQAHE